MSSPLAEGSAYAVLTSPRGGGASVARIPQGCAVGCRTCLVASDGSIAVVAHGAKVLTVLPTSQAAMPATILFAYSHETGADGVCLVALQPVWILIVTRAKLVLP